MTIDGSDEYECVIMADGECEAGREELKINKQGDFFVLFLLC